VRNFSHRSSKALPSEMVMVFTAVSVAMPASQRVGLILGRGTAKDKVFRRAAAVNSTSSNFLAY
jgi:hypothetical protein